MYDWVNNVESISKFSYPIIPLLYKKYILYDGNRIFEIFNCVQIKLLVFDSNTGSHPSMGKQMINTK